MLPGGQVVSVLPLLMSVIVEEEQKVEAKVEEEQKVEEEHKEEEQQKVEEKVEEEQKVEEKVEEEQKMEEEQKEEEKVEEKCPHLDIKTSTCILQHCPRWTGKGKNSLGGKDFLSSDFLSIPRQKLEPRPALQEEEQNYKDYKPEGKAFMEWADQARGLVDTIDEALGLSEQGNVVHPAQVQQPAQNPPQVVVAPQRHEVIVV
ncbi:hypothetical protein niasHT_025983 [Heterodera trifolii]|uniref:Uncharacterized protein n=1 Tax=Heterodera trifolii TaxID=157864 RepID=A0ABD2JA92_9BILA